MEILKRVCINSSKLLEYNLEGRKLILNRDLDYDDMYYPVFEGDFPQLSNLFLELTGHQIQELNLEVDENYDKGKGELYSQLVIDLDKVDEVYKKYNIPCITRDDLPEFISLGISFVKDYTNIGQENWKKDESYYWTTSMGRKELHLFSENYLFFHYDGFAWECSKDVPLTEDQVNDIASKLGLSKECQGTWGAFINPQETVLCMSSKSIKALVKDYLSGLTFDPDYEFFKEEYDINLDYSDFIFFVKEVERGIAISKEMAERYKLSESQRKLKDMVDFWIATFPKDFSVEELASVLIDTLQGVVSHGR